MKQLILSCAESVFGTSGFHTIVFHSSWLSEYVYDEQTEPVYCSHYLMQGMMLLMIKAKNYDNTSLVLQNT